MAAARYHQTLACRCGAAITVHWIDHGYRASDPRIERVVGPAVRRRLKAPNRVLAPRDDTDVLCGRCGAVLHRSEVAKQAAHLRVVS